MKRGWALLLLEHFDDAFIDAKRSLKLSSTPNKFWNAHEIIGHCLAKTKNYKESEAHLMKALEILRKSSASNEEKAAVAVRVATVLKMVKEENKPKNRSKESAKKQENLKQKRIDKRKKNKQESQIGIGEQALAQDEIKNLPSLPKVSLGKNSKLECASAALSVVVKDGRGRCVRATKDISAGTSGVN